MMFENGINTFGGKITTDEWCDIRKYEGKKPEGFYHTMNFSEGERWNGFYNLEEMFPIHCLPKDYTGKTVLDIGPMDGFFTFLAEKGNAKAVYAMQPIRPSPGFSYAHRILNSKVTFYPKDIYDFADVALTDDQRCDVIFCFTVLLHLPDIYRAIRSICNVCREVAYISTTIDETLEEGDFSDKPYLSFRGYKSGLGSPQYFFPNIAALVAMAKSTGF